VWVLRDQDGSIYLHQLLLGSLLEIAPLDFSMPGRSQGLRPEAVDVDTDKAVADRTCTTLQHAATHCSTLQHAATQCIMPGLLLIAWECVMSRMNEIGHT